VLLITRYNILTDADRVMQQVTFYCGCHVNTHRVTTERRCDDHIATPATHYTESSASYQRGAQPSTLKFLSKAYGNSLVHLHRVQNRSCEVKCETEVTINININGT
jgi:hypothetical protein